MHSTILSRRFVLLICFSFAIHLSAQKLERKYLSNQTYTYDELMASYAALAAQSKHATLVEIDAADNGDPLALFVIGNSNNGAIEPFNSTGLDILIMNGIHAGESCGIDASLHWAEDILENIEKIGDATIYIIPAYNVGGYENKSCCTRANQNGPENMGFRGNGNNLDLNRDFMKMDAANTKAFRTVINRLDPDVFVDTHSTNGADYQYKMTLIPYQSEKWPKQLDGVYTTWFEQAFNTLNQKEDMAQYYVNVWGRTPESGFSAFHATSIYSTGYAGLYRTFGITAEAHMFKTYPERVEATWQTLDAVLESSIKHADDIIEARKLAALEDQKTTNYAVNWALDSSQYLELNFNGYQTERFTSNLTGQPRYRYNRENPVSYPVKFYPKYAPTESVAVPKYYALHAGQHQAIANLKAAHVQMQTLKRDTTMQVSVQYVDNITYSNQPYEGHFPHRSFSCRTENITENFKTGDVLITSAQPAIRFILEALEPQSPGSFFRWNYFDTYLQQKEWFSAYIFEEKAITFLDQNPEIKREFEEWRDTTEGVKDNAFAQLYWIYKKTPYYEKEHMRIPVFRIY